MRERRQGLGQALEDRPVVELLVQVLGVVGSCGQRQGRRCARRQMTSRPQVHGHADRPTLFIRNRCSVVRRVSAAKRCHFRCTLMLLPLFPWATTRRGVGVDLFAAAAVARVSCSPEAAARLRRVVVATRSTPVAQGHGSAPGHDVPRHDRNLAAAAGRPPRTAEWPGPRCGRACLR